tara:strand:+ start:33 stop:497 length:465 start_codon:yes stop_codon:yes gene_type:complete
MRNLIALSFLLVFSCNLENKSQDTYSTIQDSKEIHAIKTMLKTQQDCWNKGDIEGFMQGYWNSKELIFTSLKHKPTYGWKETLKRYKESYPSKESMGELIFNIIDLELTSNTTATLKGKWELIKKDDHPNGIFWLNINKFDNNWLITKDSTISL